MVRPINTMSLSRCGWRDVAAAATRRPQSSTDSAFGTRLANFGRFIVAAGLLASFPVSTHQLRKLRIAAKNTDTDPFDLVSIAPLRPSGRSRNFVTAKTTPSLSMSSNMKSSGRLSALADINASASPVNALYWDTVTTDAPVSSSSSSQASRATRAQLSLSSPRADITHTVSPLEASYTPIVCPLPPW